MDTHRAFAGRTTPPFSNSLSGPDCSPTAGGNPSVRTKLSRPLCERRESLPWLSPHPHPLARTQSQRTSGTRRIGRTGTSGWAPAVPVPGIPTGSLCSPVQHFADPLAHASPGGGGQAHAAAALSWQVLDGGHHMVRRGRWRWWLQLGLRRLGRDHRGGGGGGWLAEGCPAHSARAPGPGTRRGPGRAAPAGGEAVPLAKRLSGRHPRAPAASSQRSALGLLPSPGCTPSLRAAATSLPGLFSSCDPSPGTPRQVAAKGVGGDPELPGPLRGPVQREERGCRVSVFSPSA